jgi:hypothetical protein
MAYEYVSAADLITCTFKCSVMRLLVTDPEYGGPHDKDNDEENGPGIYVAVGFAHFWMIAHCIPLVCLMGDCKRSWRRYKCRTRPQ